MIMIMVIVYYNKYIRESISFFVISDKLINLLDELVHIRRNDKDCDKIADKSVQTYNNRSAIDP